MKQANFFTGIIIFSILLYAGIFFLQPVLPAKAAFGNFIFIQLFILAVTMGFHLGLIRSGEKSNSGFVRFFMGATSAKLLLYMMVMVGYALFNKETAFGFILHFFIFYLLYTIFEVAMVYRKFSSNQTGQ
jgi:hypothetical protein